MTAASAEMLRNGVTTSVEMYFHPERIAAAVGATGARAIIATPLLPLPGLPPFEEQLRAAVELAAGAPGDGTRRVRHRAARRLHRAARGAARRRRRRARARPAAAPARRRDGDRGRGPAGRARAVGPGAAGRARRPRRPGARRALRAHGRRRPRPLARARRRRRALPGQQRQAGQRDRAAAGHARPRHPGRAWAPTGRRPTTVWTCSPTSGWPRSLARLVGPLGDGADRRRGGLAGHRRGRRRRSAGPTWGSSRPAGGPTSCTSTPGTWCSSRWATRATCWPTWSGRAPGRHVRDVWVGGRQVVRDGASTTVDTEALRVDVATRAARLAKG